MKLLLIKNLRATQLSNIDIQNKLKEEPFSYRVAKENKVFIYWNSKQTKILK